MWAWAWDGAIRDVPGELTRAGMGVGKWKAVSALCDGRAVELSRKFDYLFQ